MVERWLPAAGRISIILWPLLIGALLFGASSAAIAGTVAHAAPPPLFQPGAVIDFSRRCAFERDHSVQAHARMVSPTERARALVNTQVGFFGLEPDLSIFLSLEILSLDAGASWGNSAYSLQLVAHPAAGVEVAGQPVSSWHEISEPHPKQQLPRPFNTDAAGRTRWRSIMADGTGLADPLSVPVARLGMQDTGAPVALSLIIRNLDRPAEIRLRGPSIRIPEAALAMQPQRYRELTLVQTLNPREEAGLVAMYRRGWKYRGCAKQRKRAREAFMQQEQLIP